MIEESINLKIKQELDNPIYDTLDEVIEYTIKKHNYKSYDLVKLIIMIYQKNYSFLSNDNGYREQFKLLDEYFNNQYGHSVMTFLMIKEIIRNDKYESLCSDIALLETLLRTKKKEAPSDLCIFSYPISNDAYNDLMFNIEANDSFKYALAITYDKLKTVH